MLRIFPEAFVPRSLLPWFGNASCDAPARIVDAGDTERVSPCVQNATLLAFRLHFRPSQRRCSQRNRATEWQELRGAEALDSNLSLEPVLVKSWVEATVDTLCRWQRSRRSGGPCRLKRSFLLGPSARRISKSDGSAMPKGTGAASFRKAGGLAWSNEGCEPAVARSGGPGDRQERVGGRGREPAPCQPTCAGLTESARLKSPAWR
jgi:hypothetical protein